jgi:hypothetical protein
MRKIKTACLGLLLFSAAHGQVDAITGNLTTGPTFSVHGKLSTGFLESFKSGSPLFTDEWKPAVLLLEDSTTVPNIPVRLNLVTQEVYSGSSSPGRATASQAVGSGFESRLPLSAGSNKELAEQRAEAVRAWLAKNGNMSEGNISVHPVGESQPTASNATEQGRQKNRRVEIVAGGGSAGGAGNGATATDSGSTR